MPAVPSDNDATETLWVFYTLEDDIAVTKHPNCMVFNARRGQEIILLDVMVAMPEVLGTQYSFWASESNATGPLVLLQSPTSVVPVSERGRIFLHLVPSSASLVVPIKQSLAYADMSRQQIYDPGDYQAVSDQATAITQSPLHNNSGKTKRFGKRCGDASVRPAVAAPFPGFDEAAAFPSSETFDPFNLGDQPPLPPSAPTQPSKTQPPGRSSVPWPEADDDDIWTTSSKPAAAAAAATAAAESSSSHRSRSIPPTAAASSSAFSSRGQCPPGRYRDRADGDDDHDHPFSASQERSPPRGSGSGGSAGAAEEGDLSVAAIAEATSQAARSIFSFATKSLKTVATASTAAVSKAAEGKGIAEVAAAWGQAVGQAGPLALVKVGNTRVRIVRELAQGGFGVVLLAQDAALPEDSRQGQYALKQMRCQSREQVEEAQNEVRSLQRFAGHAHIVSLVDHSSAAVKGAPASHRTVLLLFPLHALGTAWDRIERCTGEREGSWYFSERRALKICMGVARALDFMHDSGRGFTHRDVKPHNVLLGCGGSSTGSGRVGSGDDPDHPVLTDLGSVAAARVEVATRQQALAAEDEAACKTSAAYRAPELTSAPQPPFVIDESVDVWGLGCTLYCLAFGHSPFESTKEGVLTLAILNGRFSYPAHYRHRDCQFSEAFAGLVNDMLQLAPRDRPSAADVVDRCQRMLLALQQ